MPIAALIDLVAKGGVTSTSQIVEPVKQNCFRLRIWCQSLLATLQAQFPGDNTYLSTIVAAMVGDTLPLDVSFTAPDITVEPREIRGRGNLEVKYGGWTRFGSASVQYYNFLNPDTYKFFYRWATLPGALNLVRNGDSWQANTPSSALLTADGGGSSLGGYKVNGTVSQYYVSTTTATAAASAATTSAGINFSNATNETETEFNRWILQGIWPSSVGTSELNNAGEGDPVYTTVSFTADICMPSNPKD